MRGRQKFPLLLKGRDEKKAENATFRGASGRRQGKSENPAAFKEDVEVGGRSGNYTFRRTNFQAAF